MVLFLLSCSSVALFKAFTGLLMQKAKSLPLNGLSHHAGCRLAFENPWKADWKAKSRSPLRSIREVKK
jgi:hypothetical protein